MTDERSGDGQDREKGTSKAEREARVQEVLDLAVRKRAEAKRRAASSAGPPEHALPYTISLSLHYREGSHDFHTDGDALREVVCGDGERFNRFSVRGGQSLERPGLVIHRVSEGNVREGESTATIDITVTGHESLPLECSWRSGSSYSSEAHSSDNFNERNTVRVEPGSTRETVRVSRERTL